MMKVMHDGDDDGISKGDRVEAKVKGWTKYYKGEITSENRDGTYDIKFDDGERKSGVKSSQIKSKKKIRNHHLVVAVMMKVMQMAMMINIKRGDRVEAKVSGWTKYYSGEITRVNRDGTYDIKFDDGERKSGVKIKSNQIKKKENDKKSSSKSSQSMMKVMQMMAMMIDVYQSGDRVEAKVSGWTKYYKGEITSENRDGTYDISLMMVNENQK